jgi:phosphoribosylformimino-5-aminoimidazole carboxamide ribotide isomerase
MLLFPAIDLKDGRVVRLKRGDYDQVTRYEIAPEQAAADFEASGASCLHMVDLNGAKGGAAVNFDAIARIAGRTRLFLQVGGGIRDEQRIRAYLDAGVSR